jgi:pimeloyl-ACP methyl ester carboxylesterase
MGQMPSGKVNMTPVRPAMKYRWLLVVVVLALLVAGGVAYAAWFRPDSPAASSAPADEALGVDVTEGELPIDRDGETLELAYCSNADPQRASEAVRTVVVAMHGSERNACDYAGYAVDSAAAAGRLESTLVVAPMFAASDDLSDGDTSTLYWTDSSDGWRSGEASLTDPLPRPWSISSFAALDELVATVDDTAKFPNLTRVVVAGHSAGGQVVNRYSLGTPGPSGIDAVDVHYVVMNPSSYVYLSVARFTDRGFGAPSADQVAQCADYNQYKYGMEGRNDYMSSLDAEAMIQRFVSRDVVYLLGESDTDPEDSSMDTGCEAELQGSQRLERGTNFWRSLQEVVGPSILLHQSLVTVPGVGHDGHDMFTSEEGQAALFG